MYIVSKNHNVKDVYVHCGLWLWIEVDIASWYRVAIIERVKLIIECHKVWQLHFLFRMGRVSFLEKLINYSSQINLALKTMTIKLSQLDCRWKDQGSGPVWLIVLCSCTRHSSLTMPLSTRSINVYFFLSSREYSTNPAVWLVPRAGSILPIRPTHSGRYPILCVMRL